MDSGASLRAEGETLEEAIADLEEGIREAAERRVRQTSELNLLASDISRIAGT